jgi:purine-binding chemotaxis protein CheW
MLLPVADPRRRLGLSDCALALDDRIIVVRTPTRRLGLLVDADMDLADCAEGDVMPPDPVLSGLQFEGIARLEDGLILIHDLAKFLSLDEERSLDEALGAAPAAPPPAMQDAPA